MEKETAKKNNNRKETKELTNRNNFISLFIPGLLMDIFIFYSFKITAEDIYENIFK